MARSLPKVGPFLVTVDLKLKWPELPRPTLQNVDPATCIDHCESHKL